MNNGNVAGWVFDMRADNKGTDFILFIFQYFLNEARNVWNLVFPRSKKIFSEDNLPFVWRKIDFCRFLLLHRFHVWLSTRKWALPDFSAMPARKIGAPSFCPFRRSNPRFFTTLGPVLTSQYFFLQKMKLNLDLIDPPPKTPPIWTNQVAVFGFYRFFKTSLHWLLIYDWLTSL